ncbi:MAG: 6-phosphofructokinase, partial [Caldilineaceae bacterium]|nr:6-phosphofructokinase [Caldilineaceae bacterium]
RNVQAVAKRRDKAKTKKAKQAAKAELQTLKSANAGSAVRLAQQLEELTGLESRLTILGHLQRGGTPSAADRLLATQLGTACTEFIQNGQYGVMVALQNGKTVAVPLKEVAGKLKTVPPDHEWIQSARGVGTCLGD